MIVGPTGKLVGNVIAMGCLLVDGKITGNISVNYLTLRANSIVHGNITCKSVFMDKSAIVVGKLNVHPQAPEYIDSEGKIIPNPETQV
jgi:cytoskeletal protein CcmA (bactofilin family)